MYDPLSGTIPAGDKHPDSYWAQTAGPAPADDGTAQGELDCDVAIIGAGYTGLSCAHFLARRHGIRAVVLEANRPGWGCSGRNGGFARPAIGRFDYAEMVRKFGVEHALRWFHTAHEALAVTRQVIAEGGIACDVQADGYLRIAHSDAAARKLESEAQVLRETYRYPVELLDRGALERRYMRGPEACGALRYPDAFGLHPLKFVYGLLALARAAGARVHSNSAVLQWRKEGGFHLLRTGRARVRARAVVLATNGYTEDTIYPAFRGRLLPVLSHIVVTPPLSAAEKAESILTYEALSDTRRMLHYFRLLPDDRIMFGGRGAIVPGEGQGRAQAERLLASLRRKFPALGPLRAEYDWHGWIAVTYDQMPHVFTVPDDPSIHYCLGCMGSGVSLCTYAGKVLAARIAGDDAAVPAILPFQSHLPAFPLPGLRRTAQRVVYLWKHGRDSIEGLHA